MDIAIGIILIVASLILIVAVLFQEGKQKGMGAISGGSNDTFFAKSKEATRDKKLSTLTTIVAVIFVIVVLVSYLLQ